MYHLSIADYGTATAIAIDVGAVYSLYEGITVGISLHNLNGASFGDDDDVPHTFLAGISYYLLNNAVVNVDIVKDIRYEPTYRAGVEFSPHEIICIRTGVQGELSRLFGGIGISILPFTVDYGIATHADLGLTHSIGISFIP